jgi:uncharacterized protein
MTEPTDARPVPVLRGEERSYFSAAAEGNFVLQRCDGCDAWIFYPRVICPHCHGSQLTWRAASGRGSVYSLTVLHRPGRPGFSPPYVLAMIDLDEGVRMMANVLTADPESVRIGDSVEVELEDRGAGWVVPQFRVAGAKR